NDYFQLDGKHAELPQLINGHLEEIRVFREQIKRMKEVLKQEKQRRHDAEGSKDKLLYELKHLRKLAEEQKLLERENLMKTIEKLQTEAQERERLLVNLEKYAVNLEKNQRFESLRSSKAQREMRETCQQLLDKIRELEQTVQEKQKIIELGNIYSKRTRAQSLTAHFGPSTSTPPESSGNQVETVTGTPENAVNNKCTLRDRIKVFDQKRQDMERKRERIRRKRQQQSSRVHSMGDELEVELSQPELFQPPAVLQNNPVRPFSARLPIDKVTANNSINTRPRSSYNLIVLPKINSKESLSNNENDSVKVPRSSMENKLVRFCLSTRKSKKALHCQDDALFEELRRNELLARMVAESQLARARDSFPCSLESLTRACKTSSIENNLASKTHSQSLDQLSEEHVNDISDQRRISTYVNEDDSPSPFQPECITPTDFIDSSKVMTTRGTAEMNGPQKGLRDTGQETKHLAQLHPVDAIKVVPPEQIIKNDDCISHSSQLLPSSDLFQLLPVHDSISKTCQPCGDHTDTPLTTDVQAESVSSDGLAMGSEDLLWQETPSVHLTSSLGSSVMYHALSGMSVLDDTKGEGSDVRYMSEVLLFVRKITSACFIFLH
ncbi:Lebercilin, partial [Fasciolopsis buskii]